MRMFTVKATAIVMMTALPTSLGLAQSTALQSISAADKATGSKAHPEFGEKFGMRL